MSPTVDALRPAIEFFPGRSPRWIADACRAKRIPGAVKIGRVWMLRASDVERLVTKKSKRLPTPEEVAEDLRRRGLS